MPYNDTLFPIFTLASSCYFLNCCKQRNETKKNGARTWDPFFTFPLSLFAEKDALNIMSEQARLRRSMLLSQVFNTVFSNSHENELGINPRQFRNRFVSCLVPLHCMRRTVLNLVWNENDDTHSFTHNKVSDRQKGKEKAKEDSEGSHHWSQNSAIFISPRIFHFSTREKPLSVKNFEKSDTRWLRFFG